MSRTANGVDAMLDMHREGERMLGRAAWRLLCGYGRFMNGPHSGSYVSGVPFAVQRDVVARLVRGETVDVHLMHRHRSGHYESSSLRWSPAGLVMVFADREVDAQE
jgi:hypothetical protein